MLNELMSFTGKEMPDPNFILKPKPITIKEKARRKRASHILRKKASIRNVDGYDELVKLEQATLELMKEQEAFSLAEKILKRQQDEQDEKRREILKQLNKKKYINLNKFLTRTAGFEQKKNFDLEQKRFKKLEEESKICKERPLLSHKTIEMCKTLKKKPIHKRTDEIIKKREKNINELKNKDYTYNIKLRNANNTNKNRKIKANKSMDNAIETKKKRKKKEYIINDITKNKKKMSNKEMEDYYNRQKEWKNKLKEKNERIEKDIKGKKESGMEDYFHPHISRGSVEIINAKNEANELNRQFQGTEYNNFFYVDNDTYTNNFNYHKSVYDRLYEDNVLYEIRKNDYLNKTMYSFQPFTNKNKYRQIQPKYNDINTNRQFKKKTRNYKNGQKGNRSVEYTRNNENEIGKNGKKDVNDHWINTLLKLKNGNNSYDDFTYRLNIRQASAWNQNHVNNVPYRGRSLEIVKFFI